MKKQMKIVVCGSILLFLSIGCIIINSARAQTPVATSTPKPTPQSNAAPVANPAGDVSVTANPVPQPKVTAVEGHLELDTIIQVQIDNFDQWVLKNDPSKLVPYVNGLAIHGDYPAEIHTSKNHVHFHLKITPE